MDSSILSLGIAQIDIVWENPKKNIEKIKSSISKAKEKNVDLLVFPEVTLTGFSMQIPQISISPKDDLFEEIQQIVTKENIAIILSLIIQEENIYYNRAYLFSPNSSPVYQDKRHIFRMGGEADFITPATERKIFEFKGWNIFVISCYDLRFPVWCRNQSNEYDLLIDVANWPQVRRKVWNSLLQARAIENLAYVCGVNRVGDDPLGLTYSGDSCVIDPRGNTILETKEYKEEVGTILLSKEPMDALRKKFPVWKDADSFTFHL